ncbi:MAG TPA: hypothetical protein VF642_02295 [Propionibacteriaceae bacterium]|jgi:hypothetical protein
MLLRSVAAIGDDLDSVDGASMMSEITIGWDLDGLVPGCTLRVLSWERIGFAADSELSDVIQHDFGITGDVPVHSLRIQLDAAQPGPDLAQTPFVELLFDARFTGLDAGGAVVVAQESAPWVIRSRAANQLEGSIGVWPVPDGVRSVRLELVPPDSEESTATLTLDLQDGTAQYSP